MYCETSWKRCFLIYIDLPLCAAWIDATIWRGLTILPCDRALSIAGFATTRIICCTTIVLERPLVHVSQHSHVS